jgi:hypothetical protein
VACAGLTRKLLLSGGDWVLLEAVRCAGLVWQTPAASITPRLLHPEYGDPYPEILGPSEETGKPYLIPSTGDRCTIR